MTKRMAAARWRIVPCLAALSGLLLGGLVAAPPAGALMARMTVAELARKAALVARGRVTAVQGRWSRDRSAIYSEVTLAVSGLTQAPSSASAADDGLRDGGREIVFRVPGGTVGGTSMTSSNDRVPAVGEEVVAFLAPGRASAAGADPAGADEGSSLTVAGHEQGLLTVRDGRTVADGRAMTADALMASGAAALR